MPWPRRAARPWRRRPIPISMPARMLAVKGDVEKIRQEIAGMPDVTLANWNSKNQVVLAGPKAAMAQAQQTLTDKGFSAMPLSVSAAFHTPLVGHAQKPFAEVIAKTAFQAPSHAGLLQLDRQGTRQRSAGHPHHPGRARAQPGAVEG